jgi:hypothetical protein
MDIFSTGQNHFIFVHMCYNSNFINHFKSLMSKFLVTRVEITCNLLTNKMLKTKNYYLLFNNLLANITCCSIAQHNSLLEASKLNTSTC